MAIPHNPAKLPRLERRGDTVGRSRRIRRHSPGIKHAALPDLGTAGQFPYHHDAVYLNKANTSTFTPTGDYQPATKKYVDDTSALPSPVLGDTIYADGAPAWQRLPGNATTTRKFLSQTGDGTSSAAPIWAAISEADISDLGAYVKTDGSTALTADWAAGPSRIIDAGQLGFVDSGGDHYVRFDVTNDLTANRTIQWNVSDSVTPTITLAANLTINSNFALASGGAVTINPAGQSIGEYLRYNGSQWLPTGIFVMDTDASHTAEIKWNENEAAADRILNLKLNGADRTIDLSGALTLGQDLTLEGGQSTILNITAPPNDGDLLEYDTATAKWIVAAPAAADAYKIVQADAGSATASGLDTLLVAGGTAVETAAADGAPDSVTVRTRSQIFITAATGTGTISGKTYESNTVPSNKILTAFESDADDITVTAEIHVIDDDWQPASITGSGAGATWTPVAKQDWSQLVSNARIYTAALHVTDAGTSGTITITSSDGASATVTYTRALDPPLVTDISVDNQGTNPDPYPAIQTQLANGQTFKITVTTESHANEVYIKDFESTSGRGLQGPFTVTGGSTGSITITAGSAEAINQRLKAYAKVTGGTAGPDFISTAPDDVDCSQTVPTFSSVGYTYPAGQEAIKNVETCDVTITHTNAATGDTYVYDDNSTGELTIPATTTYAATKTVTRLSGNYRETGTNYRLTATRTEKNGLSATANGTVKIAHASPKLTIAKDAAGNGLDRLGTDDGTNGYQDHTVYLISDQANLSTYTGSVSLAIDGADTSSWVGVWVADGNMRYKRDLRVEDGDISPGGLVENTYQWGSVAVKNRAGLFGVIFSGMIYELGGFATRTLNMGPITGGDPPYTHTADIGVPIVETTNTTVVNTSKGGSPSQTYEGNVTEHNNSDSSMNNYWTTVSALGGEVFDDYTQYFHCSDKKFYDSVTAPGGFNVTIAESG